MSELIAVGHSRAMRSAPSNAARRHGSDCEVCERLAQPIDEVPRAPDDPMPMDFDVPMPPITDETRALSARCGECDRPLRRFHEQNCSRRPR